MYESLNNKIALVTGAGTSKPEEEAVAVVAFLTGNEASFVTGANYKVASGVDT